MEKINYELPIIDINRIKEKYSLTDDEEKLILGIMYEPNNGKGTLRGSRPKASGESSWLWRNVMMYVSPEEKFHATSTSLDSYIESSTDKSKMEVEAYLSSILNKILDSFQDDQLTGANHWKEANGVS